MQSGPSNSHERGRAECMGGLQVGEKHRGREVDRPVILPRLVSFLNRVGVEKASCFPETNAGAWWLETDSKPSVGRFLIHIDAQDGQDLQDFFWRRRPCSPKNPQIPTRSSPESVSRAATDYHIPEASTLRPVQSITVSIIISLTEYRHRLADSKHLLQSTAIPHIIRG